MQNRPPEPPHSDDHTAAMALLFVAACPLLLSFLNGSTLAMLAALVHLGLFALALWLIAQGIRRHAAYNAAEVAHRPRVPQKLLGSVMVGLLALILAASHFSAVLPAAACGVLATLLCLAAFGLDPMQDKETSNPDYLRRQRVRALSDTASDTLDNLVYRVDALEDADLSRRTDAVRQAVTRLLRAFAQDPAIFEALNKPLVRFLEMAVAEVDRLEQSWLTETWGFARKRYVLKLAAMAEAFEARARRLRAAADQDGIELEADLLLDRMQRETAA